jgi:hypothetical protein
VTGSNSIGSQLQVTDNSSIIYPRNRRNADVELINHFSHSDTLAHDIAPTAPSPRGKKLSNNASENRTGLDFNTDAEITMQSTSKCKTNVKKDYATFVPSKPEQPKPTHKNHYRMSHVPYV